MSACCSARLLVGCVTWAVQPASRRGRRGVSSFIFTFRAGSPMLLALAARLRNARETRRGAGALLRDEARNDQTRLAGACAADRLRLAPALGRRAPRLGAGVGASRTPG